MQEITAEYLKTIAAQIVRVADPLKVILFGSRARGNARPDSDIDLIVIAKRPPDEPWSRIERIGTMRRSIRRSKVPIDILLFTPEEVSRWQGSRNHVIHRALTEGAVLYERP